MTPATTGDSHLKQILIVALGGALGSVARFKLGGFILHHLEGWNFPLSTFAINLLGCGVIGVLAGLVEQHALLSFTTRAFLFTGVVGGFTTFSAFGYETAWLLRRGLAAVAFSYAALSVVLGVAAVLLGMKIASAVWPGR